MSLSVVIPRCPAGVQSLVLHSQEVQAQLWVEAALPLDFHAIFVQNHLVRSGTAAHAAAHVQRLSDEAWQLRDLQDGPTS